MELPPETMETLGQELEFHLPPPMFQVFTIQYTMTREEWSLHHAGSKPHPNHPLNFFVPLPPFWPPNMPADGCVKNRERERERERACPCQPAKTTPSTASTTPSISLLKNEDFLERKKRGKKGPPSAFYMNSQLAATPRARKRRKSCCRRV
jgi:hypothetical protein